MKLLLYFFFSLMVSNSIAGQSDRDSITVYYFMSEECRICQYYSLTQNAIFKKYNDAHTSFVGLFPNTFSSVDSIKVYKEKYDIPFTLKKEFFHTKTNLFGVSITPEVVVYNEDKEKVLYQGRIDNSYVSVGKRRRVVTETELIDALEDLENGVEIRIKRAQPIGCFVMKH